MSAVAVSFQTMTPRPSKKRMPLRQNGNGNRQQPARPMGIPLRPRLEPLRSLLAWRRRALRGVLTVLREIPRRRPNVHRPASNPKHRKLRLPPATSSWNSTAGTSEWRCTSWSTGAMCMSPYERPTPTWPGNFAKTCRIFPRVSSKPDFARKHGTPPRLSVASGIGRSTPPAPAQTTRTVNPGRIPANGRAILSRVSPKSSRNSPIEKRKEKNSHGSCQRFTKSPNATSPCHTQTGAPNHNIDNRRRNVHRHRSSGFSGSVYAQDRFHAGDWQSNAQQSTGQQSSADGRVCFRSQSVDDKPDRSGSEWPDVCGQPLLFRHSRYCRKGGANGGRNGRPKQPVHRERRGFHPAAAKPDGANAGWRPDQPGSGGFVLHAWLSAVVCRPVGIQRGQEHIGGIDAMMPTISSNQATSGTTGQGSPGSTSSAASTPVDKNMFLQLLVAQLQNQDPMNPSDGTQFVAQLAQFQQLEHSVNMGQDISAIRQDLDKLAAPGNSGAVTQS